MVLNRFTKSCRLFAREPSCSLPEAISSLLAAACSVTWAMLWMARETSRAAGGLLGRGRGDLADLGRRGLDAFDDLSQRRVGPLAEFGSLRRRAAWIP